MSYFPTIVDAMVSTIQALTPSRYPTQPFIVPDRDEGPVTPLEARVGSQSRIVEIRLDLGPGDDGAAGISDRHRADLSISIGYSTADRMRWHDVVRAQDCEAVQGALRDPSWWPVGVYSLEVLDPATHVVIEDETGREVGRIVTIPVTLRYESEP